MLLCQWFRMFEKLWTALVYRKVLDHDILHEGTLGSTSFCPSRFVPFHFVPHVLSQPILSQDQFVLTSVWPGVNLSSRFGISCVNLSSRFGISFGTLCAGTQIRAGQIVRDKMRWTPGSGWHENILDEMGNLISYFKKIPIVSRPWTRVQQNTKNILVCATIFIRSNRDNT